MSEPIKAIPTGGDEPQNLETITSGGELPGTNPDASAALDKALLEATDGEGAEGLELDEAAKKAAAEQRALADTEKAAADEKAAAEAKKAEEAAATKPAETEVKYKWDEVSLPPGAKAKSGEAFATVKSLAKEQALADARALAELKSERDQLAEKVKNAGQLTPEIAKELEDLRSFRAKLDVEADPKFKEFEAKVNDNVELIYSKLISTGSTPEVVEAIKKMGGPAEVNWDKLVEEGKLPEMVKRYVEGKLFENEDLIERKKKALEVAKAGAAEYVKSRAESSVKDVQARRAGVEKKIAELSPNIEYLAEKKAPAGAKPEEVAVVEAHNKRAAEIRATMQEAVENDSPEMKGLLILGIAQLQRVNGDFDAFKAKAAAEKSALEVELKTVKDKLEKVKRSSTGRISSSAPDGDTAPKPKVNPHVSGEESIEALYKEALAKQQS